jgi:hypothetical protein
MIRVKTLITVGLVSVMFLVLSTSVGLSADEGAVTGRILGVSLPIPYFFERDIHYQNDLSPDRPRIRGFTLVSDDGGYKKRISPSDSGFFFKDLPAGDYSLIRNRVDRYERKGQKTVPILTFSVAPGQLVNLGTIVIVHERPRELYGYDMGTYMKGKYLYNYRYVRDNSDEGYEDPLGRLRKKNRDRYNRLLDNVLTVRDVPMTEEDSSVYELEVYRRNIRY